MSTRRRPHLTVTVATEVYAEVVTFAGREADGNVSRIVEAALVEFLAARGVRFSSLPLVVLVERSSARR